jgi:signal transduction histidine kinase
VRLWRSLRVRLTAAFLLLAVAAVTVAAWTTVLLVEEANFGTLDAALLEEATTLANLDLPPEHLAEAVRHIGEETDIGTEKFVRITRGDGSTVAALRHLPSSVVAKEPHLLGDATVVTAGEDDHVFRVAWAPTPAGGRVAIGANTARSVRWVQRARWVISLIGAGLLVVLGGGAWMIASRATRELQRLADEVATLEAGEVERLVTVLNRLLERLDRSVGQLRRFTADAAHELRTPLAAMRARLEVALAEDTGAVPRDLIVDALEQAERLCRLAEDLLMLARVEGGAVSAHAMEGAVDVTALVREVGTALAPVAEEQQRVFRWGAEPGLVVRGAEPLLKRVLLNLVDNAFRHTPASADVVVDARRDGQTVVLEVCDEGPGVDPAVLPHVFERFRHGAGDGNGLGLALVREIVERHGGSVTLERTATGGTRAGVVLARMDESVERRARAAT